MKTLLFLAAVLCGLNMYSQSYFISFRSSGASSLVSTVKIENLSRGTSLKMNGKAILNLTYTTSAGSVTTDREPLKFFPNPLREKSRLEFVAPFSGQAQIEIINMSGIIVARTVLFLSNALHSFIISGLPSGVYMIRIRGRDYQYSGRLVSYNTGANSPAIQKISEESDIKSGPVQRRIKDTFADTVVMEYHAGDRMKFTGTSGDYSTVIIDNPESDKAIEFEFIPCTDTDGNNYSVVKINGNYWMAENLKTARYSDGTPVNHLTDDKTWENIDAVYKGYYCYYEEDTIKMQKFGCLYNWWAAGYTWAAGYSHPKGLCPVDWHIVNSSELLDAIKLYEPEAFVLNEVLKAGGAFKETGTTNWIPPNLGATNESGFTALAGGVRGRPEYSGLGRFGSWWLGYGEGFDLASNSTGIYYWYDRYDGGHSVRCARNIIATKPVDSSYLTTAIINGNVFSEGASPVIKKGVCWDTTESGASVRGSHTSNGRGPGPFTSHLSGLQPGTRYFVKAYAVNHDDTLYGNVQTFNTRVADIDGNIYKTVTVGGYTWFAENLKTTKFNDGTPLLYVPDSATWAQLYTAETRAAYCWLFNNATNKDIYGALYDFRAAGSYRLQEEQHNKNLCPVGWHVPAGNEWFQLISVIDPDAVSRQGPVSDTAGVFLSEAGHKHWPIDNYPATNETGFTNLPGGARTQEGNFVNDRGYYWDQNASGTWSIFTKQVGFVHGHPGRGYSIRCIKD